MFDLRLFKLPLLFVSMTLLLVACENNPTTGLQTRSLGGPPIFGLSRDELVDRLLAADSGMTVSNVSYWGSNQSIGTFENAESVVGFDTGIMLSSGFISAVPGPNESDRTTSDSDEEDRNGDADLDTLTSAPTVDAAALQITFVPQSDTITFRYVFGSEEYSENVGTDFNDVFAFYVNGQNYALLPDGEPVTINSVNAERNSDLYIDNEMQAADGGRDTELDGLTTVLTFTAQVTPGEPNILKLVIADVDDNLLDSVVFIEGNSLRSMATEPPPQPIVSPEPTATNVVPPTTQETVTPGVAPATTPTTSAGGPMNPAGGNGTGMGEDVRENGGFLAFIPPWLWWVILGILLLAALLLLLSLLRRSKRGVKPVSTDNYGTGNPPPQSTGQQPASEREPTGTGGVDIHGGTQGQGGQGGVSLGKRPNKNGGEDSDNPFVKK